jgi:hypothetical protein
LTIGKIFVGLRPEAPNFGLAVEGDERASYLH